MHLRRLTISGFKSFANKTVLEFAPGVTAVVGPNGSGKSNVADAIRWVFGEQSMKLLRSKKSGDLIFAGTKSRKSGSMAEVSLEFDNSDGKLKLPYSEIVLSRRLYRSGENEYFINKKKARLFDLVELLAEAGLSQSNYTVVGQGMVDQLVTLSPKERKEMLDEAVGVKQYYLRRDQAQRKLVSTRSNLERAGDVVRELEPHLGHLRRIAKRAAERDGIAQSLRETQAAFYKAIYEQRMRDADEAQAQKERLDRDVATRTDELQKLETELGGSGAVELEQRISSARRLMEETRQRREDLRLSIVKAESQIEAARREGDSSSQVSAAQGELSVVEAELHALEKRKAEEGQQRDTAKSILSKQESELTALEHSLKQAEESLTKSQQSKLPTEATKLLAKQRDLLKKIRAAKSVEAVLPILEKLDETIGALEEFFGAASSKPNPQLKEIETLRGRLRGLTETTAKAQASLGVAQGLLSQTERHLTRLLDQQGRLKSKISQLSIGTPEAARAHLRELESHRAGIEREVASADSAINGQIKQIEEFETKLRQQNSAEADLRDQISRVRAQYEQLRGSLTEVEITLSRARTRLEDTRDELAREIGRDFDAVLKAASAMGRSEQSGAEAKIAQLKQKLAAIGEVDEETLTDLSETEQRHGFLTSQISDLEKASADLDGVIAKLDVQIKKDFNAGFAKISKQFSDYFEVLFGGGRAKIELVADSEGELGVEIMATPPGKRLSSVATLSGGEKSLTSVALLCAFLRVNPSPFIVMDEVDAALDEANTKRLSQIIKELVKQTQFILITHNRRSMELADVLYGVTMGDDHASTLVSVRLDEVLTSKR
jgi:chromosome segregation protein